jgi:hypothetical protein
VTQIKFHFEPTACNHSSFGCNRLNNIFSPRVKLGLAHNLNTHLQWYIDLEDSCNNAH